MVKQIKGVEKSGKGWAEKGWQLDCAFQGGAEFEVLGCLGRLGVIILGLKTLLDTQPHLV